MKRRLYITLFFIGMLPFSSFSQKEVDQVIADILREYIENFNADLDYSDMEQILINYHNKPVSLNTANQKELSNLLFLSDKQVNDILAYRKKFKGFRTIYELSAIPSIDSLALHRLKYFTTTDENPVSQKLSPIQVLTKGTNKLNLKYQQVLEKEKGYKTDTVENYYQGNPSYLMLRFDHKLSDKVSYGFIAEKDPGEELFKGSENSGFDFYSGHFYLANQKWVKQLVIGDYHANFGQGLAFYSGMSFGKSANGTGLFRYSPGLRPSLSTNESNFLRGIGITNEYKNLRLTTFLSHRQIDGRGVYSDSMNFEENFFTSITSDGYHRTESELAKKKNLTETLGGMHLSAGFSKLDIGFTAVTGKFSMPLKPPDDLYKLYAFEGSDFLTLGSDYSFTIRNFHLYGEFGFDGKKLAGITGLNININSRISTSILYRNYPKEYKAIYANAFRENAATQNEQGLYVALNIIPAKNWSLNLYLDNYHFPWLIYNTDAPSKGVDFLSELAYRPNSKVAVTGRFRYKMQEDNISENSTVLNYISSSERYNFKIGMTCYLTPVISTVTRIDFNYYEYLQNAYEGLMAYQDIKLSLINHKLKIAMRYAFINSPEYETRFYTFESNMPYTFNVTSFYDQCLRYYLMAEYNMKKYLSFWLKFSQTEYLNKTSIGSGLSEIDGNTKTEVKLMVQVEF
jgi:hypothetical protein